MEITEAIAKHQAAQPTCGNCTQWLRSSDARMPDHGECKSRPVGHYTHRSSSCKFTPTRWSAAK